MASALNLETDDFGETAENPPRRSYVDELVPQKHASDLTHSAIDRVAMQLKLFSGASSISDVVNIGALIFREIHGGEPTCLKRGKHHPSLRRLAAHPDVPFKVTTLWRAVSIYEMSLRFPELFGIPELGISHLRAVIGLPTSVQEELLRSAAREHWTKRRLEQEASRHRKGEQRRGRKPLPKLLKWVRELERLLSQAEELEPGDFEVKGGAASGARHTLERVRERCAELESLMPPPSSGRRAQ